MAMHDFHGLKTMTSHCVADIAYFRLAVTEIIQFCLRIVRSQTCSKGHFRPGGLFRAERHFLLFKDQLEVSRHQKTKQNIIPHGKFRLVENGPKT